MTVELRPKQEANGASVTLAYETVRYDPALRIAPVELANWDRSTSEASLRGFFTANKLGQAEWLLSAMAPEERERRRALVTNKEVLDRNTLAYSTVANGYLVEKLLYGSYEILRVVNVTRDGKRWTQEFTYKRTPEGWLFTNELAEDPFVTAVLPILTLGDYRLPS